MASIGNKVLKDLISVEDQLKGLTTKVSSVKSQKEADRLLAAQIESISNTVRSLPTSDSMFSPVRKTLTAIQNTLGGLRTGLEDGIGRKDFKAGINGLKTRFIPKFRESVDALTKKLDAQSSRLDEHGLLQSETGIYDELVKVQQDVTRVQRMLSSAAARGSIDDNHQLEVATRNRIDTVNAAYGMIPSGSQLDDAADALVTLTGTLTTIADNLKAGKPVTKLADQNLAKALGALAIAMREMQRQIANSLLVIDGGVRPAIPTVLKRKMGNIAKPGSEKEKLVRSPDEHLRERITDVKGAKVNLPKSLKGPFATIRAPVVAIFDTHDAPKRDRAAGSGTVTRNFNKTALLDQYHVKYIQVEDYLILEDQLLVAIDRAAVNTAVKSMNSRRRTKAKGDEYVQYAQGVVEMLNERGSQNYDLVSQTYTANPRNANMLLFWVMPSRILDALIKRGWSKLGKWDLPFDN